MRFLRNHSTDPYYNMAFDEYCLTSLPIDEPVFYVWQNRPSVIVGYNQNVNTEVNLEYLKEQGILLVRRVTGGGAVYHDLGNLNYTIVGCSDDLERDYPEYAQMMLRTLQELGIPATLSGRNDILVEGKKVSGFAKRVCKNRLMVHGTLMYNVDLERLTEVLCPPTHKLQSKGIASVRSRVTNLCNYLSDVTDIMCFSQRIEEILSNHYTDQEYMLGDTALEEIQKLADEKYAQWEWIYGRSPRASLHNAQRMACGNVEVSLTLSENRIASCLFSGDFLGNFPTSEIEQALTDIPYDISCIKQKLSEFDISQYFDGVNVDDLVYILFPRNESSS